MLIKNIPSVVIEKNGGYKFILAKITDQNGKEKLVVRAHEEGFNYCYELVDALVKEAVGLKVGYLGGGRIYVNSQKRMIQIWDIISDDGHDPRRETIDLLEAAFPEYRICAQYYSAR